LLAAVDTLGITGNGGLGSAALPALETVTQSLTVAGNPVLTTLGTLDALTDVESMFITQNPMLPQCFVDALDERLGSPCGGNCMDNDASASCD
jgi:hypothetical protein